MTEKTKLKFKSRRFWIVVWSILYISLISFFCIKFKYDGAWVSGTMAIISGIPVAYISFSTLKKKAGEE